ncbi:MAG: Rieske (2Fe-2S) protein, partial [Arenicellales bacterium]|nr:Rieske (2Fe-2S) protein [Arenicellales bacterium]
MRSQQEQLYAAYHDPALYERENDVLFARSWVNTGSASRMASPGDAIPVTVAGLPLILLRDENGCIRGFHNVCRHRGARVLRVPCQGEKLLHCAYHGWAYGMDGGLRGTPHWKTGDRSAPADFDPQHYGLEPVRVAVWLDQVFVNIDGKAPKFEQFVAPLTSRWQSYDLSRFSLGQQRTL